MFSSSWKNIDQLLRSNRWILYVLWGDFNRYLFIRCPYWVYSMVSSTTIKYIMKLAFGFFSIGLSVFSWWLIPPYYILPVSFLKEKNRFECILDVIVLFRTISSNRTFFSQYLKIVYLLSFVYFSLKGRSWERVFFILLFYLLCNPTYLNNVVLLQSSR